jgi:hypothetical protein
LLIASFQKILRHISKSIQDSFFSHFFFQKSIWAKNEELYADFKAIKKVAKHSIEKI